MENMEQITFETKGQSPINNSVVEPLTQEIEPKFEVAKKIQRNSKLQANFSSKIKRSAKSTQNNSPLKSNSKIQNKQSQKLCLKTKPFLLNLKEMGTGFG